MTIFHLLKFPISDQPSEHELDDLPETLYQEWAHSFQNYSPINPRTTVLVLRILPKFNCQNHVADLRKRLLKYEE